MPHRAHVAHSISGRIRLKIPAAKKKPVLLEQIRKSLESMEGVHSAHANDLTGSILLHHDTELSETFQELLKTFGAASGHFELEEVETELPDMGLLVADLEKEAEFLARRSKTAEQIIDEVRKANLIVKKLSDNTIDLNLMLPMALATASVAAMRNARRGTPFWVTLAIYAFNSFVSLQGKGTTHVNQAQ
jgi:hypothetical protein